MQASQSTAFRNCDGMGLADNRANKIGGGSESCALYKVMQMHSQSRVDSANGRRNPDRRNLA
jgi:hypothetical protein